MAEFNHIVRILNTDLRGEKKTVDALRKLHGVSFMYANAACVIAKVPKNAKAGELTSAQVQRLEQVIKTAEGMPAWLKNRRKDYETGTDKHVLGTELDLTKEGDIKRLKKIKAYRGIRHIHGQPSRGQRTKSNFRRNKGKHAKAINKKS
jgi:small subunit ribosomal protein S13